MNGSMIEFTAEGKQFSGYIARAEKPSPGIIVIQEWWGLVDHIKDVCDRFAAMGFTAFAPDFYNGEKTTSPDTAGKLMMALNIAEADTIISGAISTLLADDMCSSQYVGVVGFCMGGQLALYSAAAQAERVSACVDYYGIHPNVQPAFEKMKSPVLGFFATQDTFASPEAVSALDERLTSLGIAHEFHTYEGDHAFFNDARPAVYQKEAAEDTWQKMLEFFRVNVH